MADPAPPREREHLEQIISEMTQGMILVEPDHSIAWANKAALRMHEAADVSELGANAEEYAKRFCLRFRNDHELEADNYPISRVSRHETFSDVIVRMWRRGAEGGDPISTQSAGSLIVSDPKGMVVYFALVLTDVDDQVEAEERFEAAFRANPSPALICRLSDLRFIKANAGFIEMTGWPREQVVGRSIYELDIFNRSERRDLAIGLLKSAKTIPQMEACLPLPSGAEKHVIVAGQPIEINDDDCMLFTFADLDPRRLAEAQLRHSEERFSVSFRSSPVPQIIALSDGFKLLDGNSRFFQMTGLSPAEAAGRDLSDLRIWHDKRATEVMLQTLQRAKKLLNVDVPLATKGGAVLDCLFSAETVTINNESCVLCSFEDITHRKRSEAELIEAIEAVMKDNWFGQTVVEKLAAFRSASKGTPPSPAANDLSKRERQVLEAACERLSEQEIANELGLSPHTVRNHFAALYRKLGVNRRADAVRWAHEQGIKRRSTSKY